MKVHFLNSSEKILSSSLKACRSEVSLEDLDIIEEINGEFRIYFNPNLMLTREVKHLNQRGQLFNKCRDWDIIEAALSGWQGSSTAFDLNDLSSFFEQFEQGDSTPFEVLNIFKDTFSQRMNDFRIAQKQRGVMHDLKSTSAYVGAKGLITLAKKFLDQEFKSKNTERFIKDMQTYFLLWRPQAMAYSEFKQRLNK